MSEDEKPLNDAVKDAPPANAAAGTDGEVETAEAAAKEPRDDTAEAAAENTAPSAEEPGL